MKVVQRCNAITILETLICIVIVSTLIAIAVPAISSIRRESRASLCVSNARMLNSILISYCSENKGLFLARYDDSPNATSTQALRDRFQGQLFRAFTRGPWPGYSGLSIANAVYRCPSNPWVVQLHDSRLRRTDYVISSSTITSPTFLDPLITEVGSGNLWGGRVMKIDDVWFPSSKGILFEQFVWHDSKTQSVESDFDIAPYAFWGTSGRISVGFGDGSAGGLRRDVILPHVVRLGWYPGPISTTAHGVRGRDR